MERGLLENKAREDKTGLWYDADPVPPKKYRKEGKTVAKVTASQRALGQLMGDPYLTAP